MALEEQDLSNRVVLPLTEALHPGRTEYTHSMNEAGRDLVSFGRDALGRQHILCVQVKAQPISHGASSFGRVAHVARTAKAEGVTLENGHLCYPNEVWFLTSHPFPEQKRRQVSGTLQALDKENIKFIPGEELAELVLANVPDFTSTLATDGSASLAQFSGAIARHAEGRAFGLAADRDIGEFYVTAALSCNSIAARAAVCGGASLKDVREIVTFPVLTLIHLDEIDFPESRVRKLVLQRARRRASRKLPEHIPDVEITLKDSALLRKAQAAIEKARRTMDSKVWDREANTSGYVIYARQQASCRS